MIRLVRRVLSSVLRQQTLDDDGLHTVLWPPLYILNDRPITQLSNDPNDLELLILNHLLLLRGKPALPPGVFGPHDQYKMETDSVHLRSFLEAMGARVLALTPREAKMEPEEKKFEQGRHCSGDGLFSPSRFLAIGQNS